MNVYTLKCIYCFQIFKMLKQISIKSESIQACDILKLKIDLIDDTLSDKLKINIEVDRI